MGMNRFVPSSHKITSAAPQVLYIPFPHPWLLRSLASIHCSAPHCVTIQFHHEHLLLSSASSSSHPLKSYVAEVPAPPEWAAAKGGRGKQQSCQDWTNHVTRKR